MAHSTIKSGSGINQGSAVVGVNRPDGTVTKTTSSIPVQFSPSDQSTKFDDYGLRRKTIEIGDWDMNTTASATVAHGLSATAWKNVRSMEVVIRNDDDDTYYNDSTDTSANADAGVEVTSIDATNITLNRAGTPSTFDSAYFEDTSYNRGWVTVWYE